MLHKNELSDLEFILPFFDLANYFILRNIQCVTLGKDWVNVYTWNGDSKDQNEVTNLSEHRRKEFLK